MAIRRLLIVGVFVVAMVVVFQCYWKTFFLLNADRSSNSIVLSDEVSNVTFASSSQEYAHEKKADESFKMENHADAIMHDDPTQKARGHSMQFSSQGILSKSIKILDADWSASESDFQNGSGIQSVQVEPQNGKLRLLKTPLSILNNESRTGTLSPRSRLVWPTSLTQMNSMLLHSFNYSSSMVWSSALWFQLNTIVDCVYGLLIFSYVLMTEAKVVFPA